MKIVSLYYTHKPGGFCKRLYRLLESLAAKDHQVFFYTLDPHTVTLSHKIRTAKIPFLLKNRKGLLFWALFSFWCPIYMTFVTLKLKPERYFVFSPYYATMFLLAKLFHTKPLILFLRSLSFKINRMGKNSSHVILFADVIDKIGIKTANKIVCMTQSMKEELLSFADIKDKTIDILPNNISTTVLKKTESHSIPPLIALTAGVLDERKNIAFLLPIYAELEKEHPGQFKLLVAGEGPLKNELEKNAPINVEFIGWQESLNNYYEKSQILLHPSLHEGMPNVVLEALAFNLIVLSSDVKEMKEILSYSNLTFSLSDPKSLYSKLTKLASDSEYYLELKSQSEKRAKNYDFNWEERANSCVLE